ncbi:MAG TPA: 1,4-dihydroxy-2-naphthoate polyprenyltransferase [Kofleriaceae bacterium]
MSSLKDWLGAARLRTLPAAVVPVVVGTAVASAIGRACASPFGDAARSGDAGPCGVAWGPALAALGGALAIQIGTNFANDVFDAERGADGPDRIGPVRAVSAGRISAKAMKRAMVGAFGVATACGAYLAKKAGWPVVAIGAASVASGVAYTGGPYPLGYNGLGDVFVMGFFGFVAVCGTVYVQIGRVPALAIAASVPVGALATAILVVNNLRDMEQDAKVGKRTTAVRFGRGFALAEYATLLGLAYVVPAGIALSGRKWAALPLLTLPMAVKRYRELAAAKTGPEFNQLLGDTGKLMLAHGALFALGLVLG